MNIDGNNVKFNADDDVIKAHDNGVLSGTAFKKYQKSKPQRKMTNNSEDKPDNRNKVHTVTSDQVTKDEMQFIEFLIDYIVTSNPGFKTQTVAKID